MPIGVHPTEMQLLLNLFFRRSLTDAVDDWAAPHHPVARNPGGSPGGPAWTDLANNLTVFGYDPSHPDWLEIAAADSADLDFTIEDFSVAAWLFPAALGVAVLMCKDGTTNGWQWWFEAGTGTMCFTTCQGAGINQTTFSSAADLVLGTWCFVGATRDGGSVRTYKSGGDTTATPAAHTNPLAAVGKDFHIGIQDDEAAAMIDAMLWRPRIWDRCLPASEMLAIFEMERDLFGV